MSVLQTLTLTFCLSLFAIADELMYWVSIDNPAVKMAALNGSGQVTLLNESKANYSGITLYRESLYISDKDRRSARTHFCHGVGRCVKTEVFSSSCSG